VVPVGAEILVVTYKDVENDNTPLPFINVNLSAFISSWARFRLYELIDDVNYDKVLYVDTDSIMLVEKKGERPLQTTGD